MLEREFRTPPVELEAVGIEEDIDRIITSFNPLATLRQVVEKVPGRLSYEEIDILKRKMDLAAKEVAFLRKKKNEEAPEYREVERNQCFSKLTWYCLPQILNIVEKTQGLGIDNRSLVETAILATLEIIDEWQPVETNKPKTHDYLRQRVINYGGRRLETLVSHHYGLGLNWFPTIRLYFHCRKLFKEKYGCEAELNDLATIHDLAKAESERMANSGKERPKLRRVFGKKYPWRGDVLAQIHTLYISYQFKKQPEEADWVTDETPEKKTFRAMLRKTIDELLPTLPRSQREVLILRYGLINGVEHTLKEIGNLYSVGGEAIRQRKARSLERLRHSTGSDKLRDFLDTDERVGRVKQTQFYH